MALCTIWNVKHPCVDTRTAGVMEELPSEPWRLGVCVSLNSLLLRERLWCEAVPDHEEYIAWLEGHRVDLLRRNLHAGSPRACAIQSAAASITPRVPHADT